MITSYTRRMKQNQELDSRNPILKGKIVFSIFFFTLFISALGFPQEKTGSPNAYLKRKDAVFLINQSIFLDGSKVKNVELFKKLEQAIKRPLLNQYIPISNGTGFLVSADGYVITAAHVIKRIPVSSKNEWAQWSFFNYISKYLLPGLMTRNDLRLVMREFLRIAAEANVIVALKGSDKKEYAAKIVNQNDNLDLALLKIELPEAREPIPLNQEIAVNTGDQAITIGYPLTFIMDQFLDDFKPTITNGIISALRQDKWGIQHTASVNPGNSGGPLLTLDGDLIGVNVGTLSSANNIYFAIDGKKLIGWLKEIGQTGLLEEKTAPEPAASPNPPDPAQAGQ
jgi:S1-C subfamily serine protease